MDAAAARTRSTHEKALGDSVAVASTQDVKRQLGALLVRLRERSGLSQKDAAEKLCELSGQFTVTRHELSRWEREVRIPSDFWLGWLSKVLGESVAELEKARSRSRSKGAGTMDETERPETREHRARSPRERSLAVVSLKFEHQATCVQVTGTYEDVEQASAAIGMFGRMVAPAAVEVTGAAPNGKSPTLTSLDIYHTRAQDPECGQGLRSCSG